MIKLYCDGRRVPLWAYAAVVIEELPVQILVALGVPTMTSNKRQLREEA